MIRNTNRLALVIAAAGITACGGGGSGGGQTAGIDGTGVSPSVDMVAVGTVTGFGSVFVNGIRFDTSSAVFEIDGAVGVQDDLAVGDVVVVRGSLDSDDSTSGVADSVVFDDLVEGPIAAGSIDLTAGTITVLGQTVIVTPETSFDDSIQPPSIAGLGDGDIVEVSGFRRSDGTIEATRIEPKPAGQPFELTGFVSNLDTGTFEFDIGTQHVDYSSALVEDFAGGAPGDGDLVEVKGSTLGAAGELIATRVEFKGDDVAADNGDHVEIEGLITRFADQTDFDVAGVTVRTTGATTFEGGVAGDLRLNLKVEAEGELGADGVLVASKVDIRRGNVVRVAGVVDVVNMASDTFEVLGIPISTDALTRIEDKSDLDLRPFSVDDMSAGDYVDVRGSESSGSGILAGLVERDDLRSESELRGFVTTDTGSEIVILGVTISTGPSTQYRNVNEAPISAGMFFDLIGPGSLVDVKGLETGPTAITAEELQIEIE